MLPCEQRLAHLNLERWIGYTRAHQALTQLETLFIEEPQNTPTKFTYYWCQQQWQNDDC